ncbi:DUF998 domain-containing protein [Catenuloplanes atrovinosus]|uniref:Membrane protein n=1 Tax=Catenuloplanes atrovinosus TaxID=137266 RepID=A0AAE4CAA7_9ACTN|nr:DUF998 domain-containing protein [Catenuloplanes atrovinosus]MDR7277421.1 putative membrane protein [Catenuloplanes atrovinosus]
MTDIRTRAAGTALVAAGAIFFGAEFIAAAAWTDPPYSYTHHFISNLGVRGPAEAFGQFMYSPLAWVMNAGFFLFGIAALAGVTLLPARRRWPLILMAAVLAAGGVLLAFFPGSGEETAAGDYHGLGAFAAIVGGNVLVILLGRIGPAREGGRPLVVLGVLGLVGLGVFFAVLMSGAGILIGLAERAAVYPLLLGLIRAGLVIMKRR